GIVTEGDMARNLTRNLAELSVDDIITRTPKTVRSTVLATAALALLNQHHIGALIFIDEDRRPVGLVHFHHAGDAEAVADRLADADDA
ncbi:CBS domain-containing protein, partial [Rhizobium johnstonii]